MKARTHTTRTCSQRAVKATHQRLTAICSYMCVQAPLSLQRRLSYARLRVRCVYVAELQLKRAEEAPAAREHL